MRNQPGTMKNHEKPLFPYFFPFFPYSLQNIFKKNQKYKFFLLARAMHREHFLLHCLKKGIATAKELDLKQLGKVLIFRDPQTAPIIYRSSLFKIQQPLSNWTIIIIRITMAKLLWLLATLVTS